MVTTEDPRPFLSTQRFFPGAAGGELGMIEGRCGEGKRVLRCFLEFNIFTCFDLMVLGGVQRRKSLHFDNCPHRGIHKSLAQSLVRRGLPG
jgi:hypothetical protein